MAQTSQVALFETLRTVAFAAVSATYATIGTASEHPIRMFRLANSTDTGMFLSLDGTNDHFYLPSGSFVLYDLCTNRELNGSMFVLEVGTQFYLKYEADPASGNVTIEMCYGRGQ